MIKCHQTLRNSVGKWQVTNKCLENAGKYGVQSPKRSCFGDFSICDTTKQDKTPYAPVSYIRNALKIKFLESIRHKKFEKYLME